MPTFFEPAGSISLGVLFQAQQQPEQFTTQIPLWMWFLLVVLVVLVGVIVTLQEEEEGQATMTGAKTAPPASEPVVKSQPEPASAAPPKPKTSALPPSPSKPGVAGRSEPASRSDKFTLIKGLGPKVESLLKEHGITKFDQIASMKPEEIQAILDTAEWTVLANPATWPAQAKELAERKKK